GLSPIFSPCFSSIFSHFSTPQTLIRRPNGGPLKIKAWITSREVEVEHLGFELGIRRRNRSSFGTIWEAVHYLEHNSSVGNSNDTRPVALEILWNYLQLS
ncbi:hypothetical protein LINGRAHAP2_LOCUS30732, partial [Linum grandiflorum]